LYISQKIKEVIAGAQITHVLTEDGELYSWGRPLFQNLGHHGRKSTTDSCSEPIKMDTHIRWKQLSAYCHTIGLSVDGKVYGWGWNGGKQLATKHTNDVLVPTCIPFPPEVKVKHVVAGGRFSLALTEDGKIYSWGNICATENIVPTLVPCDESLYFEQVHAGDQHIIALTGEPFKVTPFDLNIHTLLDNVSYSDIKFEDSCGGTISASKLIIASRIPTFESMLKDDTIKTILNYPSLMAFLYYIHTEDHRRIQEILSKDPTEIANIFKLVLDSLGQ